MDIFKQLELKIGTYFDSFILALPKFGMGILITVLIALLLRLVRKKVVDFICGKADDPLIVNFANTLFRTINIVILILIFLYLIGRSGIAASVLGAAGVSAFVIGFAFKDIGENFLAGILLAFNRPFNLGDTITSDTVEGKILGISLRETHVKTFDGKDVYIPNGMILKNPLYNHTRDGFLRKEFIIGLDYGSDVNKAQEIVLNVLAGMSGIIKDDKKPNVFVKSLGTSSINLNVQIWIDTFDKTHNSSNLISEAMINSIEALDKAGFNMPGDIVELKNYKDSEMSVSQRLNQSKSA